MEQYKPIDAERTNELILMSKAGDKDATDELVQGNFPLIKAVVKSYLNKSVEYDDLYQLGCVGFLKAIKNFDPTLGVKFSTYAVPMISGEIKRHLRDDGIIKISRSIKTLAIKLKAYIEKVKNETGESPKIDELASHFGVDVSDVVVALDSCQQTISIQAKIDENDPNSQNVIDKLAVFDKSDEMIEKFTLKNEILKLPEREKKIILLRYFRGKTQGEVAEIMDISQVQISRIESKVIEMLRKKMT